MVTAAHDPSGGGDNPHNHKNNNTTTTTIATIYDVIIIGAGFSGLCMAIQLIESGINNILILMG